MSSYDHNPDPDTDPPRADCGDQLTEECAQTTVRPGSRHAGFQLMPYRSLR